MTNRAQPRRRGPLAWLMTLALAPLLLLPASDTYAASRPLDDAGGPRLVAAEFLGSVTRFWAVDAAGPRRRALLGQAEHAAGWGVKAEASPDGRFIAYIAFPSTGIEPTADAELWVLETATGGLRRLATGIDVMGAPVWSPDSGLVAARRTSVQDRSRSFELVAFQPQQPDGPGEALVSAVNLDWLGAVGWTAQGLHYATIDSAGTVLHAPGAQPLALSRGIARDFALSPDGAQVAYNEAPVASRPVLRPMLADVPTAAVGELAAPGGSTLAWRPDGALTLSAPSAAGGGSTLLTLESATGQWQPLAAQGAPGLFPLRWSPAGRVLAARLLLGPAERPTGEVLAVVGAESSGVRPLSFAGPASFAGWLP